MSTKTTFKRVAAVAAAALAIGGLSAVSAHAAEGGITAATGFSFGGTAAAATVTTTNGANNYVGFNVETVSGSQYNLVVTGGVANSASTTVTGSGTASLIVAANTTSYAFTIPTPAVGTIVAKVYGYSAGVQNTTATSSLTITVTASATGVGTVSLANSTAFITESSTVAAAGADVTAVAAAHATMTTAAADDVTPVTKGTAGSTAYAGMVVGKLVDSTSTGGVALTGKTLSATISGSGLLTGKGAAESAVATTTPARVATSVTSNAGFYAFGVYSDGSAGVGTITVSYTDSSNVTTVVATKTITFFGSAATYTPTVSKAYIANSGSAYPTGTISSTNYAVKIKIADAAGNGVASATGPTVKSADTTIISGGSCATASSTGYSYCSLTGVLGAHGKTTVTFYTGSAATFDLISTTADITVSSTVADSFVITGDATASSGNIITYTITAKDKYGNPIPDGQYVTNYVTSPTIAGGAMTDYSAVSTNTASTLFKLVKFVGGVATDSVQAPFGSTSIVATFDNIGAGTATIPASVFTTLALTNAETVVTTTVGGDSAVQAATDAAQEATDAANAAYDAANNAMDSADAATAAAQDASDNASAALAAVTSLSATVAKLVKSVAAIAAALAKVQKKIGA